MKDRVPSAGDAGHRDGPREGALAAEAAAVSRGCDGDDAVAGTGERGAQRADALGLEAVVVGQQHAHAGLPGYPSIVAV